MQEHNIPFRQELSFEEQYLRARKAEQRVYSDDIVRTLPDCDPGHPHTSEWEQRSRSAGRLIKYLQTKPTGRVLETGCGNGWLSNLIASNTPHTVIAADINSFELEQGKRLFQRKNLKFIFADGSDIIPGEQSFDYIVFAASIQYFPSLSTILKISLDRLNPYGEIHIIDTRFYKTAEIAEARERTRLYYLSIGCPRMTSNYFHHSWGELKPFRPKLLFNPFSIINRLTGSPHEFPWVRISKSRQKL